MTGGFVIEPLAVQDCSAFSCGVAALDRYLKERASQDVKRHIAGCFLVKETATGAVAGYYTLAATSIPANEFSLVILKRLPRYPILPAVLIGQMAIDTRFHQTRLWSALIADAALRVLKGDTKALALVVDAKTENAVAFYRRHGFAPFLSRPMSLFLPLATAKNSVKERSLS